MFSWRQRQLDPQRIAAIATIKAVSESLSPLAARLNSAFPNVERLNRRFGEVVPDAVPQEQVGLSDEHRQRIRRFLALDDEIAQLNAQLKQKRDERAALKDVVTEIIQPLGAPIKSGESVLRVKKTVKRETLNKTTWERYLARSGYLKDPNQAKELVLKIYKDRETHDEFQLVRE